MRPTSRLLAAALLALSAGCATPQADPFAPAPAATVVHVVNRGYSDVVVYLADGNTPLRLGVVGGLDRDSLRIPNQLAVAGVRLLIRARDSGQSFAIDPVIPGAGGALGLTVQPMLIASELSVLSYGVLER